MRLGVCRPSCVLAFEGKQRSKLRIVCSDREETRLSSGDKTAHSACRYGLKSLAEGSLLDLIASVRQHARRLQRVRWFGRFSGIITAKQQQNMTAKEAAATAAASQGVFVSGAVPPAEAAEKQAAAESAALPPQAQPGGGEPIDTCNHLAMYLFALQQLAYPSSIAGLFAIESGSDDTPVIIRPQAAQDATRAVFR